MIKYIFILLVNLIFSFGVEAISLPRNAIEIASSNSGLANSENIGFNFSNIQNTSTGYKISSVNWYQDIKGGNFEYHWKKKYHHYLSLFSLSADDIDLRYITPSENPIDIFSVHHVVFSYGIGSNVNENIRLGLKTNFIYNQLYIDESSGMNIDFGLSYDFNEKISVGASVNNIGSEKTNNQTLSYPLEAAVGISYKLSKISSMLHTEIGYHESLENDLIFKFSSTTKISYFHITTGYYHSDLKNQFSCGLSFKFRDFQFDYGISFHKALGAPNIFSLKYNI